MQKTAKTVKTTSERGKVRKNYVSIVLSQSTEPLTVVVQKHH